MPIGERLIENTIASIKSVARRCFLFGDSVVARLAFNLVCYTTISLKHKSVMESHDVALHFNPRLKENTIVRNTYQNGQWGDEERNGGSPLKPGSDFTLEILCEARGYRILIDDTEFTFYSHRNITAKYYAFKDQGADDVVQRTL